MNPRGATVLFAYNRQVVFHNYYADAGGIWHHQRRHPPNVDGKVIAV